MTNFHNIKLMTVEEMTTAILNAHIQNIFSDTFCENICPCRVDGQCFGDNCPSDREMVKAYLESEM